MKILKFTLISFGVCSFFSGLAFAQRTSTKVNLNGGIVKIEIDDNESINDFDSYFKKRKTNTRDERVVVYEEIIRDQSESMISLNNRIKLLERAVKQLQEQVFDLSVQKTTQTKKYTCSLTSNFNKTYIGEGTNLIEAKANVTKACETGEKTGIHCDKNDIECGN